MLSIKSQKPTSSQKQSEEIGSNFMLKEFVLSLGIDINSMSLDGTAPLHLYAETNNLLLGALSLHGGADVNVKTKFNNGIGYCPGYTSLYISAEKGHKEFVELLMKWKPNVNETNGIDQNTALHACVGFEYEYNDIAVILLDEGADVNLANREGKTALHLAAYHGSMKLVKLLIQRGAEINSVDENKQTALHYCAHNGRDDIVDLLLEAGASANIKDNEGKLALHNAVEYEHSEAILKLVKFTEIDTEDNDGKTALHYSVLTPLYRDPLYHNSVVLTETLLKAKAKASIRDKEGRTVLHYAAIQGRNDTVLTLLKYREVIATVDNSNRTALHTVLGTVTRKS
ncbi:putative ankyrin repeat protein RF_0381 [Physella acuta]|uniref:putative ankyrin repeat protein RF_0381 n=1 Tax=Physella acuta TaxID=109671 RepID=UPI0027DE38CA|nr:putative ankyrin repeat protein RF_0381 [Physella acuta]